MYLRASRTASQKKHAQPERCALFDSHFFGLSTFLSPEIYSWDESRSQLRRVNRHSARRTQYTLFICCQTAMPAMNKINSPDAAPKMRTYGVTLFIRS